MCSCTMLCSQISGTKSKNRSFLCYTMTETNKQMGCEYPDTKAKYSNKTKQEGITYMKNCGHFPCN